MHVSKGKLPAENFFGLDEGPPEGSSCIQALISVPLDFCCEPLRADECSPELR